jgi:hypothetical protein
MAEAPQQICVDAANTKRDGYTEQREDDAQTSGDYCPKVGVDDAHHRGSPQRLIVFTQDAKKPKRKRAKGKGVSGSS